MDSRFDQNNFEKFVFLICLFEFVFLKMAQKLPDFLRELDPKNLLEKSEKLYLAFGGLYLTGDNLQRFQAILCFYYVFEKFPQDEIDLGFFISENFKTVQTGLNIQY